MTRLELQTKRNSLVAQGRAIFDLAAREKREMTSAEILDFDKFMDESDAVKREIDGGAGGKGGGRGKRLADATKELNTSEGRRVAREQPSGVPGEREVNDRRNAPLRFTGEDGEEIRGLRLDESIAQGMHDELPDGIRAEELSLGRLVKAAATGNWRGAEAEKRSLSGSSDVLGGVIVPFPLAADVIDLARNRAVCFKAGAVTIPMNSSTLKIGKLLSDPAIGWKAENAPGAFSDATFGAAVLSARTLMTLSSASVEIIEDASNLDQLLQNSLAKVLALELDRAALRGDTTAGSPMGVKNNPGVTITNLGTNGLTLLYSNAYQQFSNGIQTILNKNGIPNAVVFAPRTSIELDQLTNTIGDSLDPPPSWDTLEKFVTNSTPINLAHGSSNTCSDAIIGDFTQMLFGLRTELRIEVTRAGGGSTGSAFQNLQTWIRAYLRADVVLAHPEFFCVLDGIL